MPPPAIQTADLAQRLSLTGLGPQRAPAPQRGRFAPTHGADQRRVLVDKQLGWLQGVLSTPQGEALSVQRAIGPLRKIPAPLPPAAASALPADSGRGGGSPGRGGAGQRTARSRTPGPLTGMVPAAVRNDPLRIFSGEWRPALPAPVSPSKAGGSSPRAVGVSWEDIADSWDPAQNEEEGFESLVRAIDRVLPEIDQDNLGRRWRALGEWVEKFVNDRDAPVVARRCAQLLGMDPSGAISPLSPDQVDSPTPEDRPRRRTFTDLKQAGRAVQMTQRMRLMNRRREVAAACVTLDQLLLYVGRCHPCLWPIARKARHVLLSLFFGVKEGKTLGLTGEDEDDAESPPQQVPVPQLAISDDVGRVKKALAAYAKRRSWYEVAQDLQRRLGFLKDDIEQAEETGAKMQRIMDMAVRYWQRTVKRCILGAWRYLGRTEAQFSAMNRQVTAEAMQRAEVEMALARCKEELQNLSKGDEKDKLKLRIQTRQLEKRVEASDAELFACTERMAGLDAQVQQLTGDNARLAAELAQSQAEGQEQRKEIRRYQRLIKDFITASLEGVTWTVIKQEEMKEFADFTLVNEPPEDPWSPVLAPNSVLVPSTRATSLVDAGETPAVTVRGQEGTPAADLPQQSPLSATFPAVAAAAEEEERLPERSPKRQRAINIDPEPASEASGSPRARGSGGGPATSPPEGAAPAPAPDGTPPGTPAEAAAAAAPDPTQSPQGSSRMAKARKRTLIGATGGLAVDTQEADEEERDETYAQAEAGAGDPTVKESAAMEAQEEAWLTVTGPNSPLTPSAACFMFSPRNRRRQQSGFPGSESAQTPKVAPRVTSDVLSAKDDTPPSTAGLPPHAPESNFSFTSAPVPNSGLVPYSSLTLSAGTAAPDPVEEPIPLPKEDIMHLPDTMTREEMAAYHRQREDEEFVLQWFNKAISLSGFPGADSYRLHSFSDGARLYEPYMLVMHYMSPGIITPSMVRRVINTDVELAKARHVLAAAELLDMAFPLSPDELANPQAREQHTLIAAALFQRFCDPQLAYACGMVALRKPPGTGELISPLWPADGTEPETATEWRQRMNASWSRSMRWRSAAAAAQSLATEALLSKVQGRAVKGATTAESVERKLYVQDPIEVCQDIFTSIPDTSEGARVTDRVTTILSQNYRRMRRVYLFYATGDHLDAELSLQELLGLVQDAKLLRSGGLGVTRQMVELAFRQVANARGVSDFGPTDFVAFFLRLAEMKKGGGQGRLVGAQVAQRLRAIVEDYVCQHAMYVDLSEFQTQLYGKDSARVLERHQDIILACFRAFATASVKGDPRMTMKDWVEVVDNMNIIDATLGHHQVRFTFVRMQDLESDPALGMVRTNAGNEHVLKHREFVECLAALACFKAPAPYLPLSRRLARFLENHFVPTYTDGRHWRVRSELARIKQG
eukprot:TRINITY_DN20799_c0_g1_i1.p1 TRINITY_DN20799_c0_g1~~TRINITY_DN20799_c0_g1_i1.p1  ORF type:complete len:1443 (+),score=400.24 TRINITY_DN20799_c0_g1_i1:76-4329(+)